MDDATNAILVASLSTSGEEAIASGLIDRAELEESLAAARRGDQREARRLYLTILCRMSEEMGT